MQHQRIVRFEELMKNAAIIVVILALAVLGWFALSSQPDAVVNVEAETPGVGTATESVAGREVPAMEPGREAVRNTEKPEADGGEAPVDAAPMQPGRGNLDIRVLWNSGDAAAGVQVRCGRGAVSWDFSSTKRTDAEGRVSFKDLLPGSVYVRALRGAEGSFFVQGGETTTGTLRIRKGVTVDIQVVDGDLRPVEKARIWLSERWQNNCGAIAGETDREGRLQLVDVSPHCTLAARAPGFGPSRLYPVQGSEGATAKIRISMERGGGKVSGIVVNPQGKPVRGAMVLIGKERPAHSHRTSDGTWVPGAPPVLRRTGADGKFRADIVSAGPVEIQVRHDDFASWRGEGEATQAPLEQRIILADGASVSGEVRDEADELLRYATISVGRHGQFASRRTQAGRDGSYEIRGLPAAELTVQARRKELRAETKLVFGIGEKKLWSPILRDPAQVAEDMLVGRVVDHEGNPLTLWRVAARQMPAGKTVSARTDGEGRFRIKVPWEVSRVWVHEPMKSNEFPALIVDDVRRDGEKLYRIEIAQRRSAEISGEVVDAMGKPVQARIQAWHVDLGLWREFKTDAKTGAFRIRNITPGKLELKIVTGDHPWKVLPPQTVTAGQQVALGQIALAHGGRIEGANSALRPGTEAGIGQHHRHGAAARSWGRGIR